MVAHGDLVGRLADIDCALLERRRGGRRLARAGVRDRDPCPADALDGDPRRLPPLLRPIEPWDTQSVIYTSGTTGPSKGCCPRICTCTPSPGAVPFVSGEDRYLVNMPMFHIGGMGLPSPCWRGRFDCRHDVFSTDYSGAGARDRVHRRIPARRDGHLPDQGAARSAGSPAQSAHRVHRAAERGRAGVLAAIRQWTSIRFST